jgi:hypothetical protein
MKDLEGNGPPPTEPGGHGPMTHASAGPAGAVPIDSLPIPQRLAMIEQALAGLGMALQNAASRDGVTAAVKEVREEIAAVESRLKAFESIVTESLTLSTRLDGLDRAMVSLEGKVMRLPSADDFAGIARTAGQISGSQEIITGELGAVGRALQHLLRMQKRQFLLIGVGLIAGLAMLLAVLWHPA